MCFLGDFCRILVLKLIFGTPPLVVLTLQGNFWVECQFWFVRSIEPPTPRRGLTTMRGRAPTILGRL